MSAEPRKSQRTKQDFDENCRPSQSMWEHLPCVMSLDFIRNSKFYRYVGIISPVPKGHLVFWQLLCFHYPCFGTRRLLAARGCRAHWFTAVFHHGVFLWDSGYWTALDSSCPINALISQGNKGSEVGLVKYKQILQGCLNLNAWKMVCVNDFTVLTGFSWQYFPHL